MDPLRPPVWARQERENKTQLARRANRHQDGPESLTPLQEEWTGPAETSQTSSDRRCTGDRPALPSQVSLRECVVVFTFGGGAGQVDDHVDLPLRFQVDLETKSERNSQTEKTGSHASRRNLAAASRRAGTTFRVLNLQVSVPQPGDGGRLLPVSRQPNARIKRSRL